MISRIGSSSKLAALPRLWGLGAFGALTLGLSAGCSDASLSDLESREAALAPPPPTAAVRTGMTWTVLAQQGGYVRVGADAQTNPYLGDATVDQFLPILCLRLDGQTAPNNIVFDFNKGWARGSVKATPAIAATVLTSQARGDEICTATFGTGWKLAEFHDGRYGPSFSSSGGWSFWAAGALPAGTRFWTAINDQPANPWNSAGTLPAVTLPKFVPSEAPVPNRFMAFVDGEGTESAVRARANSLVAQYGGAVVHVFPTVNGFSFSGSEAQARAMSQNAGVESVEQDTYATSTSSPDGLPGPAQSAPSNTWHKDRIDQRYLPLDNVYAAPNDGSGVSIYILDTGFRRSHIEFGGRARQDADFIFPPRSDDCEGHGTGVGSVAGGGTVGIAPGATLISIRIADCQGNAYNPLVSLTHSTIVAGLDWVARNHQSPAVANVSYGVGAAFWHKWFGKATPMDKAVKRAVDAGVAVVVAAGNEGENAKNSSPARAPEAISVSATGTTDRRPWWANYGKVEMFAPGDGIWMASLASDTLYTAAGGTSFAAPVVAGAIALYLHDHPSASPAEVRAALGSSATSEAVVDPGDSSTNRLVYVASNTLGGPHGLHGVVENRWGIIKLFWIDGATEESGFKVERSDCFNSDCTAFQVVGGTGANVTDYTTRDLRGYYKFRVRAFNSSGAFSAYSNVIGLVANPN